MSDQLKPTIKQLVPAEPGWYLEEHIEETYHYARVACWALVEHERDGEKKQYITGITGVDMRLDKTIRHAGEYVYVPHLDMTEAKFDEKMKSSYHG